MTRSVNKTQIDIILNRMLSNEDIACGYTKVSRAVLADFWTTLTEDLNTCGPPIKNVTEWKKVWTDQKRYVRSKALLNLKIEQQGGTHIKRLSATEQCIFDLVGMNKPAETAIDKSFTFGLSNHFDTSNNEINSELNNEDTKKFMAFDEIPVGVNSDNASNCSNLLTPLLLQDPFTHPESSSSSIEEVKVFERENQKISTDNDSLSNKFISQENLRSMISEMGDSIQNYNTKMKNMIKEIDDTVQKHNKEMKTMMKRIYRSLDDNNDLKVKKLKEMQRHHKVSEHLRLKEVESKIEKNKKLIEIEQIKLLKKRRK